MTQINFMETALENWREFEACVEEALQHEPDGIEVDACEIGVLFNFGTDFYANLLAMARQTKPNFSIRKGYAGLSRADDFSIVFERIRWHFNILRSRSVAPAGLCAFAA